MSSPVSSAVAGKVEYFGTKSHAPRQVTLTIAGTDDSLTLTVEVTTKVGEVKQHVAQKLGVEPEQLQFVLKTCNTHRKLLDTEEMARNVIVRGIRQWKREKARYPHPHCIIGAGHSGLRQALSFHKEGIEDYVIFDRLEAVGGTAWLQNANASSKLQTELGVYHLQYDPAWECPRTTMSTWPSRDELRAHFQEVSREFGILEHCQLGTEVNEVKCVVDDKQLAFYRPEKQHYEVTTVRCDGDARDEVETVFSTISCYPGVLSRPNRVEFKGEEEFDGPIGYGMFDEFDYHTVEGKVPAIIGCGAFGIENVRTCLEHGAAKVLVICRRKNLAMPRVVSWWINQCGHPVSGAALLDAMKPMYDLIPDDPWEYYGVVGNRDRTVATIRQHSRFGIGDVFFLASYYGKVEVVLGTIKRMKPDGMLLEDGRRLQADAVIKTLGFRADNRIDKMFGIKEMVGFFVNGDWRRWVCTEFNGVDAGKFGGTSFSPGVIQNVELMSWFINYPKDLVPVFDAQILPKRKSEHNGAPAYCWDPRQGGMISMMLSGGIIPGIAGIAAGYGPLNQSKQLGAHPLEHFIDECAGEWKAYCDMFRAQGDDRPPPPYPYTYEFVREIQREAEEEGEAEKARQIGDRTRRVGSGGGG